MSVDDTFRLLLTTLPVPSLSLVTVVTEPSLSVVGSRAFQRVITLPSWLVNTVLPGKAALSVVFSSAWEMVTDARSGLPVNARGSIPLTRGGTTTEVSPRSANLEAGMVVSLGETSRLLKTVLPLPSVVTVVFEPSTSDSAGSFLSMLVMTLPAASLKVAPPGNALGLVVFRSSWEMVTDLRSGLPANALGAMDVTPGGMVTDVKPRLLKAKAFIAVTESETWRLLPMMLPWASF